jgi:hypothetical protein
MTTATHTLRFLTPCFCAGADQTRAEIRPSSIRGQLRWWFRALGNSARDETAVFGGLHGDNDNTPAASPLVVRVSDVVPGPVWNPPRVSPNDVSSYVWYFASVSGKTAGAGRNATGPRWQPNGAIAPKTTFKLHILFRRELAPALRQKFGTALNCFLALGGIGLRVTRGLGAFTCDEFPFAKPENAAEVRKILTTAGFKIEQRDNTGDLAATVREIGSLLKGTRKSLGMKAERPSPFGASSPRQTSAIYFRPVLANPSTPTNATATGAVSPLSLVIFEAPHTRVLDRITASQPPVVGATPSKLTRAQPARRR